MSLVIDDHGAFIQKQKASDFGTAIILDCLSKVEFIGAGMILRVPHKNWDERIHQHALDELYHGQALLEEARRIRLSWSGDQLKTYELKLDEALEITHTYMRELMHKTLRWVGTHVKEEDRTLHYYYFLSFLIERRLMKIYPFILNSEAPERVRKAVKKIIGDERDHLLGVSGPSRDLAGKFEIDIDEAFATEAEIAGRWLGGIRQMLESAS